MSKAKHIIKLEGFNIEQGKIPISMLDQLTRTLLKVASGTLRLYLFGASGSRKHNKQAGFKESLDFQLTGIEKGSTILEIEAPTLNETVQQIPLFSYLGVEHPKEQTALSLAFNTFQKVFSGDSSQINPDKQLLKELLGFKELFHNEESRIDFYFEKEAVSLNKQKFEQVKKIEESILPSVKRKIVGKLDVLKFSSTAIELIANGRKIRAVLGNSIAIQNIMPFFGKEVAVIGTTNFGPNNQVTSIEVESIAEATVKDEYFRQLQIPISDEFNVKKLAKSKGYTGTSLNQVAGKWPGDEPLDDLISLLAK
jgi:hypothetical protein